MNTNPSLVLCPWCDRPVLATLTAPDADGVRLYTLALHRKPVTDGACPGSERAVGSGGPVAKTRVRWWLAPWM